MPRPSSKDKVVAAFHANGWQGVKETHQRIDVRQPSGGRRRFHQTMSADGIVVEAQSKNWAHGSATLHPFTMAVRFLPDGCYVSATVDTFGPYLGKATLAEVLAKIESYGPDAVEQLVAERQAEDVVSRAEEQRLVRGHFKDSRAELDAAYSLAIESLVRHCHLTPPEARGVVLFLVEESTHVTDLAAAKKKFESAGHGYGALTEGALRGRYEDGELVEWFV